MNEEDKKKLDELTDKYTEQFLAEKEVIKEKRIEAIAKVKAEEIVYPNKKYEKYLNNYKNNLNGILNAMKKMWGYICVLDKAAAKELNGGKK